MATERDYYELLGVSRDADDAAEVAIDLVEAARGTSVAVPFELATVCTVCGGDGVEPGTQPKRCPRCDGAGQLHQVSRSVFGEFVRAQACPECRGRGVL